MAKGDIKVPIGGGNLPKTASKTTLATVDVTSAVNYPDGYAIISQDSPTHFLYVLNRTSSATTDGDNFVATNVAGVVWEKIQGASLSTGQLRGSFDITLNPAQYPKALASSAVNATQVGNGSGAGPIIKKGDYWYVINNPGTDTIGPVTAKTILTNNAIIIALVDNATNSHADFLILENSSTADGPANVATLRTLGTGPLQAVAGNDIRLTNARTPLGHAASHKHGGNDEIATITPTAFEIPKADSTGKLNDWISTASTTIAGKLLIATQIIVDGGVNNDQAVTALTLATNPRIPTQAENDALQGIALQPAPSGTNRFITEGDSRTTDARTTIGTALLAGRIIVGSATNLAASVALSGDATLSNTGVITLDKNAILNKPVVTSELTDYILISDTSDTGNLKKVLVSAIGSGHIIENNGVALTQRSKLNIIGATSIVDDAVNNSTILTVAGGHIIQGNGTSVTKRGNLNFSGFTVTDDSVNNRTTVTLNPTSTTQTDEFVYAGSQSFTLSQIPQIVLGVFLNGQRIKSGSDFTVTSGTLTLVDTLVAGDEVTITYFYNVTNIGGISGLPAGGTIGQILKKNSSVDGDASFATLLKGDVGLANVDNTSDINKPISTAQSNALAGKEPSLGNPTVNGQVLSSTTLGVRSWINPGASATYATQAESEVAATTLVDTNASNTVNASPRSIFWFWAKIKSLWAFGTNLVYAANIAWDWMGGYTVKKAVTATGNFTLTLSNVIDGAEGHLEVTLSTITSLTITLAGTGLTFKDGSSTITVIFHAGVDGEVVDLFFEAKGTTIKCYLATNTANFIRQGGQSLGVAMDIKTTDNFDLVLGRNITEQLRLTSLGVQLSENLRINTVGKGLQIKEGVNATMGVATFAAGTVTVSTSKITALSRVQLTVQSLGTVTAPKAIAVSARTAGVSFTILSADATDTSQIAWTIIEPL